MIKKWIILVAPKRVSCSCDNQEVIFIKFNLSFTNLDMWLSFGQLFLAAKHILVEQHMWSWNDARVLIGTLVFCLLEYCNSLLCICHGIIWRNWQWFKTLQLGLFLVHQRPLFLLHNLSRQSIYSRVELYCTVWFQP